MKKLKLFIRKALLVCITCSSVAFVSCNNEDVNLENKKTREIRFSAKTASVEAQIPNNQKIGIFIGEDTATPTTTYEPNLLYTADALGNLIGSTQHFPNKGNGVEISAYHPYSDSNSDSYTFSVKQNQAAETDIYQSDLLFCPEFIQASTTEVVALQFKHMLSQVTYKLTSGDGNPNLTGAQVCAINAASSIEFNRKTGELASAGNPTEISFGNGGGIVVPQTVESGTPFLKIKLKSGDELYYTLENTLTLESGKRYNFSLKINQDGSVIPLGQTCVDDWQTGLLINGSVNENDNKKSIRKWSVIGNSITRHKTNDFWWGYHGMAATKKENDYVHVLTQLLENEYGGNVLFNIVNHDWEYIYRTQDENLIAYQTGSIVGQIAEDDDLIVINLGENIKDSDPTLYSDNTFRASFNALVIALKNKNPNAHYIIVGSFYETSKAEKIMKEVADTNQYKFVPIIQLFRKDGVYIKDYISAIGNQVLGDDGKLHTILHDGVAVHPDDRGMRAIAELIFGAVIEK